MLQFYGFRIRLASEDASLSGAVGARHRRKWAVRWQYRRSSKELPFRATHSILLISCVKEPDAGIACNTELSEVIRTFRNGIRRSGVHGRRSPVGSVACKTPTRTSAWQEFPDVCRCRRRTIPASTNPLPRERDSRYAGSGFLHRRFPQRNQIVPLSQRVGALISAQLSHHQPFGSLAVTRFLPAGSGGFIAGQIQQVECTESTHCRLARTIEKMPDSH